MCKIVSVGFLQLQGPKLQLKMPFDQREPVDSYLRAWLATCREDEALKPPPSRLALHCGDDTQSLHGRRCLPSFRASILSTSLPRVPRRSPGCSWNWGPCLTLDQVLCLGAFGTLIGQTWVLWHRGGSPKEDGVLSNLDTSCVEAAGTARYALGPLETFQWLPA